MTCISQQHHPLWHLEQLVSGQKYLQYVSTLLSDSVDSEEDVAEEEKNVLLSLYFFAGLLSCFLFHSCQYKMVEKVMFRWGKVVYISIKYNDEVFLMYFRVDKGHFHALLDLI